ncbi:hypothetical protein ACFWH4_07530 [Streptomyces sp. NPDC127091]|uniref:Uncharacterized protein n=1 Tax=Streptomyces cathayae TaxID=3031124 RepID=A0ABY8JSN5_9ACTN|nr:hypothetical protein [Streptomyces sp. HUAS 5]WGD38989.1 hypothetical protein PYS65_01705 [Streptomyces sp. HUAS 5]
MAGAYVQRGRTPRPPAGTPGPSSYGGRGVLARAARVGPAYRRLIGLIAHPRLTARLRPVGPDQQGVDAVLPGGFDQSRDTFGRVRRPAGAHPSGGEAAECLIQAMARVPLPCPLDGLLQNGEDEPAALPPCSVSP